MILVYDVETSIKNVGEDAIGEDKAAPWHPDNQIVIESCCFIDEMTGERDYLIHETINTKLHGFWEDRLQQVTMLVGHNINFDMHYARKTYPAWDKWLRKGDVRIWDTQKAEYLFSGQEYKFPTLDFCCENRGLKMKPDRIKQYWKDGIDTEDIPRQELLEYGKHDAQVTADLFFQQWRDYESKPWLHKIWFVEMQDILATNEIEYNGMFFNKRKAYEEQKTLEVEYQACRETCIAFLHEQLPLVPVDELSPESPDQLSVAIFGGSLKIKERVATGEVFKKDGKTGKKGDLKYKWEQVPHTFKGLEADYKEKWRVKKEGFFSTGDDVLQVLRYKYPIINTILRKRELHKEIKTYLEGYRNLTWGDNLIHGKLNTTLTATTRLSSSSPNLQNVTNQSSIKKCFESRFGEDGVLIEGDFSQLEVFAQAFLSGDPVMKEDLRKGLDFHLLRVSYKLNESYEELKRLFETGDAEIKAERTAIKTGFSFPRAYGAGATSISERMGIPEFKVKQIIHAEEQRYCRVVEWQKECIEWCEKHKKYGLYRTKLGYPAGRAEYIGQTGKSYIFYEEDITYEGAEPGKTGMPVTKIKNYEVQSFARDIIACCMFDLRRDIQQFHGRCFLANTVHDQALLDIHKDIIKDIYNILYNNMVSTPSKLFRLLGIEFDLPLKAEVKIGKNWGEMYEANMDDRNMA